MRVVNLQLLLNLQLNCCINGPANIGRKIETAISVLVRRKSETSDPVLGKWESSVYLKDIEIH